MYSHIIKIIFIILDTYVQSIYINKYLVCNGFLNTIIDSRGIHLINIEWQRNGQKIHNSSHYTLHNLDIHGLYIYRQLQINSLKTSIAGTYSCVAWIGNDKTKTMTNSTTVIVPSELLYL